MNEIDWIKALDRVPCAPGHINVAPAVIRAIRASTPEREPVFSVVALLAVVVGTVSVWIALPTWLSRNDPVSVFTGAFQMVLQ